MFFSIRSKSAMYEFLYDYVKPKYGQKGNLCYIDTDSFIVHVKTDDTYKDIAEDFETRFDTWDFQIIIGLMKDELGGQIMKEFVH